MNREESLHFERDGYVIIKNAIFKEDCEELMKNAIKPILRKNNLYYTGKKWRKGKTGMCFAGNDGQPINKKYRNWYAIYKNTRLNKIIDNLHPQKRWKWIYGADQGLGWIHIRYPYTRQCKWKIPRYGWHIDGNMYKDSISTELTYIIMPLINSIKPNGGGTALFRGSHQLINYWIHNLQNRISLDKYIKKCIANEINKNSKNKNSKNKNCKTLCNIIETNGEQGDILIIHPHLIHAPSNCSYNNKIRITFNLATGHK